MKNSKPNKLLWWLGGIAFDISMLLPWKWKVTKFLCHFGGPTFAFVTYDEWLDSYKNSSPVHQVEKERRLTKIDEALKEKNDGLR